MNQLIKLGFEGKEMRNKITQREGDLPKKSWNQVGSGGGSSTKAPREILEEEREDREFLEKWEWEKWVKNDILKGKDYVWALGRSKAASQLSTGMPSDRKLIDNFRPVCIHNKKNYFFRAVESIVLPFDRSAWKMQKNRES